MSHYSFQCNRCPTSAVDTYPPRIQLFVEHHMRTMHPLYTAEASAERWAPKPKRRRIRSSRITAVSARIPGRVGA